MVSLPDAATRRAPGQRVLHRAKPLPLAQRDRDEGAFLVAGPEFLLDRMSLSPYHLYRLARLFTAFQAFPGTPAGAPRWTTIRRFMPSYAGVWPATLLPGRRSFASSTAVSTTSPIGLRDHTTMPRISPRRSSSG